VIPNSHPLTDRRCEGPAMLAGPASTPRLSIGGMMFAPRTRRVAMTHWRAHSSGASTIEAAVR
jgi:hypothetical protein